MGTSSYLNRVRLTITSKWNSLLVFYCFFRRPLLFTGSFSFSEGLRVRIRLNGRVQVPIVPFAQDELFVVRSLLLFFSICGFCSFFSRCPPSLIFSQETYSGIPAAGPEQFPFCLESLFLLKGRILLPFFPSLLAFSQTSCLSYSTFISSFFPPFLLLFLGPPQGPFLGSCSYIFAF